MLPGSPTTSPKNSIEFILFFRRIPTSVSWLTTPIPISADTECSGSSQPIASFPRPAHFVISADWQLVISNCSSRILSAETPWLAMQLSATSALKTLPFSRYMKAVGRQAFARSPNRELPRKSSRTLCVSDVSKASFAVARPSCARADVPIGPGCSARQTKAAPSRAWKHRAHCARSFSCPVAAFAWGCRQEHCDMPALL